MSKNKKIYLTVIITVFMITVGLTCISFYERDKAVNTPVLYVGDEPINQIEYAFYYVTTINSFNNLYGSYASQIGLDLSGDLSTQECSFDGYDTWADFFTQTTLDSIQENKALYCEASKEGYTYDCSDNYTTFKEQIINQATNNDASVKEMYKTIYGDYATESDIKKYYTEYATARSYYKELNTRIEISDDEINEAYEADKNSYDMVTYREFVIYADVTDDMTDGQIQEAMDAAKEEAKNFYDQVYDGETFKKLAKEYSSEETLFSNKSYDEVPSAIADWLFQCEEEKETTYIEDEDNYAYHIVYFISREQDTKGTAVIRHILICPEVSDITTYLPTDDDYKKALSKAKEIQKEFEDNGSTEDEFIELAKEYSEDTGTSSNGGLMSNVTEFDENADDWIFNEERVEGDTTIVKTSYGYEFIYFKNLGDPEWLTNIKLDIREEKLDEKLASIKELYPVTKPQTE